MHTTGVDLDRDPVGPSPLLELVGRCDRVGAGQAIVAGGAASVGGAVELRKARKIRARRIVEVDGATIRGRAAPWRVHHANAIAAEPEQPR